jgi:hypothetical protein
MESNEKAGRNGGIIGIKAVDSGGRIQQSARGKEECN